MNKEIREAGWLQFKIAAELYLAILGNFDRLPIDRTRLIKAALAIHGLNGRRIALAAGVQPSAVNGVIRGAVRARKIERLVARTLGLPVEYLFGPPGIKGNPNTVKLKSNRARNTVNAEESTCDRPEDDLERARRLVG